MITAPHVSIIIPVYNEERLISLCLESVVNQTLSNIEIIIVDDASHDNSQRTIEKFSSGDDRIRFIKHRTNKGQGEARNTGIRESRGLYVFFLDADDYLPHAGLEDLYKIAREYDDDIIYGKTESEVNVDGMYISCEMRSIQLKDYPPLLYNQSVWNKLIKRTFIISNHLFFGPPRHAEDVTQALKCNLLADKISITTKVTYYYHWHRQLENVTRQKISDARHNVLNALKLIEEYGYAPLTFEMQKKTASNVFGSMVRAKAVYDRQELYEHLQWWRAILSAMPATIFDDIPRAHGEFCRLIVNNRMEEAVMFWDEARSITEGPAGVSVRLFIRLKDFIKQVFCR